MFEGALIGVVIPLSYMPRPQQMWKLDLKWKEKEVLGKRRESRQRRNGKIRPCTLLLRLRSMASWGGRDRGALE